MALSNSQYDALMRFISRGSWIISGIRINGSRRFMKRFLRSQSCRIRSRL